MTFNVDAHVREQDEALERAKRNGVQVDRGTHDVDTLTALMDIGWRLLVVTLVPLQSGFGLHYLLGRKQLVGWGYAFMNPAEGRDVGYLKGELNAFLFGVAPELAGLPHYIGVTVGVLDFPV